MSNRFYDAVNHIFTASSGNKNIFIKPGTGETLNIQANFIDPFPIEKEFDVFGLTETTGTLIPSPVVYSTALGLTTTGPKFGSNVYINRDTNSTFKYMITENTGDPLYSFSLTSRPGSMFAIYDNNNVPVQIINAGDVIPVDPPLFTGCYATLNINGAIYGSTILMSFRNEQFVDPTNNNCRLFVWKHNGTQFTSSQILLESDGGLLNENYILSYGLQLVSPQTDSRLYYRANTSSNFSAVSTLTGNRFREGYIPKGTNNAIMLNYSNVIIYYSMTPSGIVNRGSIITGRTYTRITGDATKVFAYDSVNQDIDYFEIEGNNIVYKYSIELNTTVEKIAYDDKYLSISGSSINKIYEIVDQELYEVFNLQNSGLPFLTSATVGLDMLGEDHIWGNVRRTNTAGDWIGCAYRMKLITTTNVVDTFTVSIDADVNGIIINPRITVPEVITDELISVNHRTTTITSSDIQTVNLTANEVNSTIVSGNFSSFLNNFHTNLSATNMTGTNFRSPGSTITNLNITNMTSANPIVVPRVVYTAPNYVLLWSQSSVSYAVGGSHNFSGTWGTNRITSGTMSLTADTTVNIGTTGLYFVNYRMCFNGFGGTDDILWCSVNGSTFTQRRRAIARVLGSVTIGSSEAIFFNSGDTILLLLNNNSTTLVTASSPGIDTSFFNIFQIA
jgi:hypothetical protein